MFLKWMKRVRPLNTVAQCAIGGQVTQRSSRTPSLKSLYSSRGGLEWTERFYRKGLVQAVGLHLSSIHRHDLGGGGGGGPKNSRLIRGEKTFTCPCALRKIKVEDESLR